ncbi:imidazole glycerol phosphate synthase subunit HisF [Candidatus Peregrinibacteria bacterium CG22_combo_CG10-13_8_21_14_all_44_10]|nr:MAG: imidazole glycerol phosphate synthase subunit HisF [Candidatus Peregrinibacteria bacterium CG2_30_44_17]PIP65970.1 MAG: imidazole glycerol phosphate synthase subunit HisF [Candidatus Peregrinibacteria bacterium CG22_combo_CG10-13_8_21_14_all_44_10]PIS04531.1 MAG: imidazole glycerol phosphate synthase subunit HisF [Candidatus Peregrinibacteria bacterium CG10_big_fil_rev_8_21_14_0_10_44_7]PIX79108.1 MAG: imidazole glycerol phosphate synthase subunit HisF [Candidatus Peregrinibacteria bacte
MLAKRIIPCLDVRDGRLTKGIKFQKNVDIGDPVLAARKYYEQGADEIVFYDISASPRGREIMLDVVRQVAKEIFIPFSVGGGIRTVGDMRSVLLSGAEKVSINSAAVKNPSLISEGARAFGSQCVVVGIDALRVSNGFQVVINGGRVATSIDALTWAQEVARLGAGEICLNSIDADGTYEGYDLELLRLISENVEIPVIASGGVGNLEHLYEGASAGADALLAASIFHYSEYSIREAKEFLRSKNITVRL